MSLLIYDEMGTRLLEWHIGKPIPKIYSNVVRFQADGDELALIMAMMRRTRQSSEEATKPRLCGKGNERDA